MFHAVSAAKSLSEKMDRLFILVEIHLIDHIGVIDRPIMGPLQLPKHGQLFESHIGPRLDRGDNRSAFMLTLDTLNIRHNRRGTEDRINRKAQQFPVALIKRLRID